MYLCVHVCTDCTLFSLGPCWMALQPACFYIFVLKRRERLYYFWIWDSSDTFLPNIRYPVLICYLKITIVIYVHLQTMSYYSIIPPSFAGQFIMSSELFVSVCPITMFSRLLVTFMFYKLFVNIFVGAAGRSQPVAALVGSLCDIVQFFFIFPALFYLNLSWILAIFFALLWPQSCLRLKLIVII